MEGLLVLRLHWFALLHMVDLYESGLDVLAGCVETADERPLGGLFKEGYLRDCLR